MFKDFFDNNDPNKDGMITREEWDAMLQYMAATKNSAFALKAGGSGDVTKSHMLWKQTKGLPYVPSAILYRGQYVMVKDGGIVTAYDAATGEEIYQKRAVASGSYYASPVAADGHIYFASLADGAITVLAAGAKKPEVVAENPPLGERLAATPAIADNTLYVRTAGHLYAFASAGTRRSRDEKEVRGRASRHPSPVLGLRRLPPAAGGGDAGRRRGPRFARGAPHRRRQESLLSGAGAGHARPGGRRLAADLADEGPGRRAGGLRRPRGLRQQHTHRRREARDRRRDSKPID